MHADHLVSFERIVQKKHFGALSYRNQLVVLHLDENFAAVSSRVNKSKQNLSYFQWSGGPLGEADATWLKQMRVRERIADRTLDAKIEELWRGQRAIEDARLGVVPSVPEPRLLPPPGELLRQGARAVETLTQPTANE